MNSLPVGAVLEPLAAALERHGSAVLVAPPGAGKTTRVPLALMDAPWLSGRRIVVLEPRRIAARSAARHMAATLGEPVGRTVGYAMRFERAVSATTRVEIVTEGLLVRRLQADPELAGTGLVILDEFHERSLDADTALALLLEARAALRPDLRLLVMSATLDAASVAAALGDAPVIRSEGRSFPVEVTHLPPEAGEAIEAATARAIRRAVSGASGDVLAFLPGNREIRFVQRMLDGLLPDHVELHALTGDTDAAAQDRAIRPAATGRRKVVLATNVAETSLTIDGVRVVVDSGLVRRSRIDARTGLQRLVTQRIDLGSATQRSGRAGRTAPGVAIRLWPVAEERGMAARAEPEICTADLGGLVLECAAWGVADPTALPWPTRPPAASLDRGRELLVSLGALDANGSITAIGRAMADLPLEPRLARIVVEGECRGEAATGKALAALLAARSRARNGDPIDLAQRLDRLDGEAAMLFRRLGGRGTTAPERAGALLATGFPDRVAKRRGHGAFRLVGGRALRIDPGDALARADWIVAADVQDGERDGLVRAAVAIGEAEIRTRFASRIERRHDVEWDAGRTGVIAREVERLGALELGERIDPSPDSQAVRAAVLSAIRQGAVALPWTDAARTTQARLRLLALLDPSLPAFDDWVLLDELDDWLSPFLDGITRADDVAALDLGEALVARLDPVQRKRLDQLLPLRVTVPSGAARAVDYTADPPVLAVKLQEMFGSSPAPSLADGRVPLVVHLLSPAGRPVAVTRDLPYFWREVYPQVRKELRGRYPKHPWPEDPLTAVATARAKPRS